MAVQPLPVRPWFEERRPLFVRDLYKRFFGTYQQFRAIYRRYVRTGDASFAAIDQLVGTEANHGRLWALKDHSHRLWRQVDSNADLEGCFLDWVLGSLFHEAMKLKENVYMLQVYGPLAESIESSAPGPGRFGAAECQRCVERSRQEIDRQMENLAVMFSRASLLLRTMLPAQAENRLLVRFLTENPEQVEELWGEPLHAVLAEMFPQGAEYGFCAAAESYLAGDWHQEALAACQEALRINPGCEKARRHVYQLQGQIRAQHAALSENRPG